MERDDQAPRAVSSPRSELWRILKITLAISHSAAAVFVVGSHISDGITYPPTERTLAPLDLWVGFSILGAPWSLVVYSVFAYLQPDNPPSPLARWWLLRIILSLGITTLLNVVVLWWWALRKRYTR